MNSLFYRCWACFYLPCGLLTGKFSGFVYPQGNSTVSHFFLVILHSKQSPGLPRCQVLWNRAAAVRRSGCDGRTADSASHLPHTAWAGSTGLRRHAWAHGPADTAAYLCGQAGCRDSRVGRFFFFRFFFLDWVGLKLSRVEICSSFS